MRADVQRDELECDSGQPGKLDDPCQLSLHHGRATDGAAQDSLIKDAAKRRAVILREENLPLDPGLDALLDRGVIKRRNSSSLNDRAGVTFNLKQSGDEIGVVFADGGRIGFQPDIGPKR